MAKQRNGGRGLTTFLAFALSVAVSQCTHKSAIPPPVANTASYSAPYGDTLSAAPPALTAPLAPDSSAAVAESAPSTSDDEESSAPAENQSLAKAPTTTERAPSIGDGRGYINSDGVWVHSPVYSPNGPPPGATAHCGDGTYSFSQHHRGTCSHHGGVAAWQ